MLLLHYCPKFSPVPAPNVSPFSVKIPHSHLNSPPCCTVGEGGGNACAVDGGVYLWPAVLYQESHICYMPSLQVNPQINNWLYIALRCHLHKLRYALKHLILRSYLKDRKILMSHRIVLSIKPIQRKKKKKETKGPKPCVVDSMILNCSHFWQTEGKEKAALRQSSERGAVPPACMAWEHQCWCTASTSQSWTFCSFDLESVHFSLQFVKSFRWTYNRTSIIAPWSFTTCSTITSLSKNEP